MFIYVRTHTHVCVCLSVSMYHSDIQVCPSVSCYFIVCVTHLSYYCKKIFGYLRKYWLIIPEYSAGWEGSHGHGGCSMRQLLFVHWGTPTQGMMLPAC